MPISEGIGPTRLFEDKIKSIKGKVERSEGIGPVNEFEPKSNT